MVDENYEPKTKEAKKLWHTYARLGDHVTNCDQCLSHAFCADFDKIFKQVLKLLSR